MSSAAPDIAGSTAQAEADRAWQAVRQSADIQFSPLPPIQPPQTPGWLSALGEALRKLLAPVGEAVGLSWPVVEKVLIVLAVIGLVLLIWRVLVPLVLRRKPAPEAVPDWSPDRAQALALLEDADRLAAEGHYAQAAHLLLQRSVHHIASARPQWLLPASTAREIASLPQLGTSARTAFGVIAARVEASRFARRALTLADWQEARRAYAAFSLVEFGGLMPPPPFPRSPCLGWCWSARPCLWPCCG
ncbi:MAG TPA: hypothetical protein PKE25_01580 [Novosphingobium sp.]|nr:hypothetical protein [Novosphingobium sp.]